MRIPGYTKRFRRDYEKMRRSGRKLRKLETVMGMLIEGGRLSPRYRDHALSGEWQHLRDCHIEGDWILLYELREDTAGNACVIFHATDNHENLFG